MLELQLVTFEQAKALKELGFPKDGILQYHQCPYCFYNGYCINLQGDFGEYNKGPNDEILYAPSLELVAKWLRDERGLWIHMCKPNQDYSKWSSSVNGINRHLWEPCSEYNSYESALSAGIDKAIKILKGV